MKPTRVCVPHEGRPSSFQSEAARVLWADGHTVQAWHWISTDCGEPMCLTADHMLIKAPQRLAYPHYVCVYCGHPGHTRDHLLPRTMTGDSQRRHVLTVPACGQCNSMISDKGTASITHRRAIAHAMIERKYAASLRTRDWSDADLEEFGPGLRTHIVGAMARKADVLARLAWPPSPDYDLRALQRSGIENAYETGLLGTDDVDIEDRPMVPVQRQVVTHYLPGDLLQLIHGPGSGRRIRLVERSQAGNWIARVVAHPSMPELVGIETYLSDDVIARNWKLVKEAA